MKKYALPLLIAALSLTLFGCSEETPTGPDLATTEISADKSGRDDESSTRRYEVIIENLTPATGPGASQPFSPPILATHEKGMHIFRQGRYASDALSMVAEDAMGDPLLEMLNGSDRVHGVSVGDGVVLPSGETRLEIEATRGMRNLSLVFMLVNTNDAFGGLDSVRLPNHGEKTYRVRAWDAGTEVNTESFGDIPGPCCGSPGMGTDEHRKVRRHRGIMGTGDLDAELYGWERRVAKVTVRLLEDSDDEHDD